MAWPPIKASKKAELETRRKIVAEKMLGGFTLQAIADELGVAQSTIMQDSKVIRQRWVEAQIETMGSAIAQALHRYERYLEKLEPFILKGDKTAVQTAAGIQNQIIKLLGLEHAQKVIHEGNAQKPVAVEVNLSGLSTEELKTLRALMEKAE